MEQFNKVKKIIFIIITLCAIAGIAASVILTLEKIQIVANPDAELSCSINSVFNCASVIKSDQAEVIPGLPNPILGIVGYSIMFAFSFLTLMIKENWNRFVWFAAIAGAFGSFVFSYWLLFSSVYSIGILCPYCLVSCFAATNIFFGLLVYLFYTNALQSNNAVLLKLQTALQKGWYIPLITLWYLVVIGIVVAEFALD